MNTFYKVKYFSDGICDELVHNNLKIILIFIFNMITIEK